MDSVSGPSTTTHENWFQREGNAVKSMCGGFLVVILTSFLVFWNETNLVIAQATADVMNDATVVEGCTPTSDLDTQLVFSACNVNAPDIASHLPTPLQAFVDHYEGASLNWNVEIYQWVETKHEDCTTTKDNKGGTTKHCTPRWTYSESWSSDTVYSGSFHESSGHQNHGSLPNNVRDGHYTVSAGGIFLSSQEGDAASFDKSSGYFVLDGNLQGQFPSGVNALSTGPSNVQSQFNGGDIQEANLRHSGGYLTTSSGSPEIGDIRISVKGSTAKKASVCAKASGGADGNGVKLGPWPPQKFDIWGRKTYELQDLRAGTYDLLGFIAEIKSENQIMADILRLVGLILMICAFNCIFKPLSVMADLLMFLNYCTCCLGDILDKASQAVIGAVSFGTGCCCFTFVFCAAWCVANPTYAVLGLVVMLCICGAGAGYHFTHKKEAKGREVFVDTPYLRLGKGYTVVAIV